MFWIFGDISSGFQSQSGGSAQITLTAGIADGLSLSSCLDTIAKEKYQPRDCARNMRNLR